VVAVSLVAQRLHAPSHTSLIRLALASSAAARCDRLCCGGKPRAGDRACQLQREREDDVALANARPAPRHGRLRRQDSGALELQAHRHIAEAAEHSCKPFPKRKSGRARAGASDKQSWRAELLVTTRLLWGHGHGHRGAMEKRQSRECAVER
jgi:hypothetical protein